MERTKNGTLALTSALTLGLTIALFGGVGCHGKATPVPREVLRLARFDSIASLDPAQARDSTSLSELSRSIETLYHFPPTQAGTPKLEPLLAEGMPEFADSGRTLTFHLKKGVLFQDDPCFKETQGKGREVTSEDILYTFKRLLDPRTNAVFSGALAERIEGGKEFREGPDRTSEKMKAAKAEDTPVTPLGITATDRYTIQIKLNSAYRPFLSWLSHPSMGIIPKEAIDFYQERFAIHPIGTGPYFLSKLELGQTLIWSRNPTFREPIYFDEIRVSLAQKAKSQWENFLAGNLDLTPIPVSEYPRVVTPGKELTSTYKKQGFLLIKLAHIDVTFEAFNMKDPLVGKNPRLRQALSLAVPDQKWLETLFGGMGVLAQSPLPPALSDAPKNIDNPYRKTNRQKAKELLARAGYPGGTDLPKLTYLTLDDPASQEQAELLKSALEEIGVQISVESFSKPKLEEAIQQGVGHLWSGAWRADYPDAENFLQLFYGPYRESGLNDTGYQNPLYDQTYETWVSRSGSDSAAPQRQADIKKMLDLLIEDCPWIPGVHRISYWLTRDTLKNMKIHDFDSSHSKYYKREVPEKKK